MDYNKGKLLLEQKVEDFYNNEKIYLAKTFQETENRTRFINPFFQALGWEFEQTGIARQFWDVHQEFSQKDNSSTKKPDYAFRADKKVKFFVEAKAPWVPLTDKGPVFQAKRYAFSTNGKAPIVILTDFQEFRVFNSLKRPILDNPLDGLLKELDLTYQQYLDNWDLLWNTFSKEAVLNGSLEPYIAKAPKNTKTLDVEFLEDLTSWREILAKNIAIRNEKLNVDEINEAVQRVLDRLVFIRNLEDREIEEENLLYNILNTKEDNENSFYLKLIPIFQRMNVDYNGLLFKEHFSEQLLIDNKVIKDLIKNMCYPVSPFQFDVIEPEILGRIYEKFLGSKIRLTDSHRAKVEEKPEVRHAGGVYYTPEYIVNYIVENTVGKLIEGNNPEQISKIKIVDPACGSGSFLIGAFDYLIRYHENWYSDNQDVKKYKKDYYINEKKEISLTIEKKGEILTNNIYGVDIDREATEVAMMSLYLKILEQGYDRGETVLFKKGSILPDLTKNIKCGNSLIDNSFFEGRFDFDDNEWKEIKPFDWKKEFNNILFDCVIGNPPYIRIQELNKWSPKEVEFFNKTHQSAGSGNYDIYVLFIERGLSILSENGLLGFILPHKFFNAQYGKSVRKLIADGKHLNKVVHFGSEQVFKGASTYTCLLFLSKNDNSSFEFIKPETLEQWQNGKLGETGLIELNTVDENEWNFSVGIKAELFNRLNQIETTLETVTDRIFQGLKTSADKIYIVELKEIKDKTLIIFSRQTEKEYEVEKELFHPLIKGGDSKKYQMNRETGLIIFFPYAEDCTADRDKKVSLIPEKTIRENYPLTYSYLKDNKSDLEARERGKMKGPQWYAFGRTQALEVINLPKIFTPDIAPFASYSLDENGEIFFTGGAAGGYGILVQENIDREYILGLLNSRLLDWYNKQIATSMRGDWYSFESRFIKNLPIIIPESESEKEISNNITLAVKNILETYKSISTANTQSDITMLNNKASMLEDKIDSLVFELYGITEDEKMIFES